MASDFIQKRKLIKVHYLRESDSSEKVLKPLGVVFSEYLFYLIAYESNQKKELLTVYRIDRIQNIEVLDKKFTVTYIERFQAGEFRKRIQFMHAGERILMKLIYKGKSPQVVLDRLPTANFFKDKDGQYFFEAVVVSRSIKMWLLSQGANIEVLEPIELREEMIETIQTMYGNYQYK